MKDRNVIWSNESLNLEDWRADLEEEYPGYSDDELYEIMCETNADYLDDERMNLNIQLSQPMTYTDKKEAGAAIIEACKAMTKPEPIPFGSYRGFEIHL